MAMLVKPGCTSLYLIIPAVTTALILTNVNAQVLEEVIVTAQRREQSLQEVPVSIVAFSAVEIAKQGFRDMSELTHFSPGATIQLNQDRINITIRGVGTAGNNQALEQSAPTFVDGVHFGRSGQILAAFLDTEQVEILRGPQPVYFGQNANAGAFSITTRKPTDEWTANLRTEVGNYNKKALEFGAGGPITDTLGIRVAGKYDSSTGYLRDLLTTRTFPEYDVQMGRVILQWTPTENFEATAKLQYADKQTDGDGEAVQRSVGSSRNPVPRDRYAQQTFITGIPNVNFQPIPEDFGDGWGVMPNQTYVNLELAGVANLPESDRASINVAGFIPGYLATAPYGDDGPASVEAHDDLKPWDAYLNLTYRLDNDIEISSLTGYSKYVRENTEDNSGTYFMGNFTWRKEHLDQWSQELRVTSPTGGMFEWMAGLYYHINDLDLKTVGYQANVLRPIRNPYGGEDAKWKSAFATVTYNFLGDKASIDLGARYTDVWKNGFQQQTAQEWIFNDGSPTGLILTGRSHTFFRTNFPQFVGTTPSGVTDTRLLEKNDAIFETSQFDPQIVLRYRPTEDLSLYAKYAEAFKSGSFEVELKSTPLPENFVFGNEYTTTYETGARSTFLDGRARGGVTVFRTIVDDLQVGTTLPLAVNLLTGLSSQTVNAGKQRVQGIELDGVMQVTDRLSTGLSGAWYDGEMISFTNAGCTTFESENAATGPCLTATEAEALNGRNASGAIIGTNTIDRSGEEMPRLPSWIITLNSDYEMPVLERHKLAFNGRFKYSDGYLTNIESFSRVVTMPTHADMNLSVGFGDIEDTWEVSLYGRNLLEPRVKYYAEYDVAPGAFIGTALGSTSFRTYGVQFRYNYN